MKISTKLNTFVLVNPDSTTSPVLTTIREYGRWLSSNFDEYTCNYELYCKSIKDGKSLLEYHPGTRIGRFFDNNKFNKPTLQSWFILRDSSVISKLKSQKLIEIKDCVPISVNDPEHRKMLRCYTVDQIQTYIQNNIDRNFCMSDRYLNPKQIKVPKADIPTVIAPTVKPRKTLLSKQADRTNSKAPVTMTMEDIEKELGYKINLVQ